MYLIYDALSFKLNVPKGKPCVPTRAFSKKRSTQSLDLPIEPSIEAPAHPLHITCILIGFDPTPVHVYRA